MNQNTRSTYSRPSINRPTPAPINTDAHTAVHDLMGDMLDIAHNLNPGVLQFIDATRGLAIQWPKDVTPDNYGRGVDAKDEPIGPTILSVCEPWEDMRCILASQYDPRAFEPYRENPGRWNHRHLGLSRGKDGEGDGPSKAFHPTVLRPTGLLATYIGRRTDGNHVTEMIMYDAVLDYVTGVESPRDIVIVGETLQTKWHAMVQAERQHRVDNYRHAGIEPIDHQSDSWGFEGMG